MTRPQPQPPRTPRRPRNGEISNKDIRRIINTAINAGWTFTTTPNGHGRLHSPDRTATVRFPGTTSHPQAPRALRGDLRRAGLNLR